MNSVFIKGLFNFYELMNSLKTDHLMEKKKNQKEKAISKPKPGFSSYWVFHLGP